MGVNIESMACHGKEADLAQDIVPRVKEQTNTLRNAEILPYHDLLDGDLVESALEEEEIEFRVRTYTPLITLWTFLTQVLDPDKSCRKAVSSLIAFLVARGEDPVSPDTGNYCKARKRLPLSLIVRLVRKIGELLNGKAPSSWLWKGREVFMVDGSTASMPDTPANQKVYPQPRAQKPGLGFPLARFVAIICLSTGAVLDLAVGAYKGKRTGETSLLRTLLHRLKPGSILLGDRYFASYFGINQLLERGVDGVFRMHQRRKFDFRRGRCLGIEDHLVMWRKPSRPEWMDQATYDQIPGEMQVRELRFRVQQPGYRVRTIVLVTTLLDSITYTKEDLAHLFLQRWHIELDLRSIKVVMEMDVLRCKSPDMVEKEIWMHMLAYNIIRAFMATAAAKENAKPRELSFKGTLQALTAFRVSMRDADPNRYAQLWEAMFVVIGYDRVGNRPGRVEPRCKKRRPKPYRMLTVPRAEARKHLQNAA
jgi:Transposase DDE domain